MQPLHIPKGARVYIGAPAQPLSENIVSALCSLVSGVAGLAEAHMPQVYFEGAEVAAQILVLVPASRSQTQPVLDAIGSQLPCVLPAGVTLDVLPMQAADPLLEPVRNAHCELFVASEKPIVEARKSWWKFWSRTQPIDEANGPTAKQFYRIGHDTLQRIHQYPTRILRIFSPHLR